MLEIAERVDHRNRRVLGYLRNGRMVVRAQHNAINPALEIACNIANFLARRDARAALVHEQRRSTKRRHAGFKGHSGAQRRLLKNQHQLLAGERVTKLLRLRLQQRREIKHGRSFARRKISHRDEVAGAK